MAWMIVCDSSCEIRELQNPAPGVQFALAPFKIRVGEREYVDLPTLNTRHMLQAMTDYNGASTTACPSPEEWAEYFLLADNVFAFTISSNLSGSYNAAQLAAEEYQQENPGKRVFVLDSLSTGPEQYLLAEHLQSELAAGKGPMVRVHILPIGTVETRVKNSLESAGINQSCHRIYICVRAELVVVTAATRQTTFVETEVCVAETVVVGNVPGYYADIDLTK